MEFPTTPRAPPAAATEQAAEAAAEVAKEAAAVPYFDERSLFHQIDAVGD